MGNPVADLNINYKTNFTDAVAGGADPVVCINKVITEAGLDDPKFQALPFQLPLDKAWLDKLGAENQLKATVFTLLLMKLSLTDKKLNMAVDGPYKNAKTIKDAMDIIRTMLKKEDPNALPVHLDPNPPMSTAAKIGIGVGIVAVLGAITYHMTKPNENIGE